MDDDDVPVSVECHTDRFVRWEKKTTGRDFGSHASCRVDDSDNGATRLYHQDVAKFQNNTCGDVPCPHQDSEGEEEAERARPAQGLAPTIRHLRTLLRRLGPRDTSPYPV